MDNVEQIEPKIDRLKLLDWLLVLIGQRDAIRRAVASPWSLMIGGILLVCAEIARRYDLIALNESRSWVISSFWWEFWAALLTFSIIYFAFYFIPRLKNPPFIRQFFPFLGVFLMMSPVVWLDALPAEYLFQKQPFLIAKLNFAILVAIGLWKLLLVTRITTVIGGGSWFKAFSCSLLAISTLTFFRSLTNKLSIAGWTGKLELNPAEQFLAESFEWINRGAFMIAILAGILIFWPSKKERIEPNQFRYQKGNGLPLLALISVVAVFGLWCAWGYPWQSRPEKRQPRVDFEKTAKQRLKDKSEALKSKD